MSATNDTGTPVPGLPLASAYSRSSRGLRTPRGTFALATTSLWIVVGVLAPLLAPADPFAADGPSLSGPTSEHPMGTDALGRDLLSGVIYGARTSLLTVCSVAVLVFLIGMTVGTVAGYRGGWLDDLLMRCTEAFQVLPRFFLALVVVAFFGPGLDRLIIVLGLTTWPLLARVVRAMTLSLREELFIDAAIAQGASSYRILFREIWPNILPSVLTFLGLLVAQVLLIETSLSFLGLSDPDAISWGYLASEGQRFLRTAWWMALFPGLAILAAVLGLNLLVDSLGDAAKRR